MRVSGAVLVVSLLAAPAAAQEPLEQNDYAIDVVQTPVLGSGRIVGLGGAYTALAEGIDGAPWNPAAYGSRTLWELDFFEWELTAGVLFPGSFSENDFFNRGEDGFLFDQFYFLTFGLRLQFGDIGVGTIPRLQHYQLTAPDGQGVSATFIVGNYGLAWQMLDGQIVLGVGARTADLALVAAEGREGLVSFTGTGPEVGILVKLADQPWRLGAALRSVVRSERIECPGKESCDPDGTDGPLPAQVAGFVLPNDVHMPWELQVGFALQVGARPLNRRWVDPAVEEGAIEREVTLRRSEREREQVQDEMRRRGEPEPPADPFRWLPRRPADPSFWQAEDARRAEEDEEIERRIDAAEDARDLGVEELSRSYVLITADLLVTGRTPHGVGVEGFLAQERQGSGDEITYSVRLGVEAEPWQGRLKLRAGSYLEPSRFPTGSYRLHGTAGFDLRLFRWDLFGLLDDFDIRVGATGDVAVRYFDWGVGVGFWH